MAPFFAIGYRPLVASPSYRLPSPYEQVPLRRRVSAMGLTIALNLFLLFLLIGVAQRPRTAPSPRGPTMVTLSPEGDERQVEQQRQQPREQQQTARPKLQKPKIVIPVPPTITPPPEPTLDLIELSKDEMKNVDKAMSAPPTLASRGRAGGADSPVVGRGPNGQALYAAEWVREPTGQELGHYVKPNSPAGYGIIACKTYPGFRVDDCIELESYPRSAYLARAVLNAAWQFKVRPPSKDGQLMFGEWVTIRIDYEAAPER